MTSLAAVTLEVPVGLPSHPDQKMDGTHHDVTLPQEQIEDLNSQPFEHYLYWARIQREEERDGVVGNTNATASDDGSHTGSAEKEKAVVSSSAYDNGNAQYAGLDAANAEALEGRRALRVATWLGAGALICTDILGPFNAPYAVASVGFVPGNILYIIFGFAAFAGGLILWKLFLALDSARYPIRSYSDIGERLLGKPMKYASVALQSVQLVINVGLICLSNGQAISQTISGAKGNAHLCFSVAVLLFALLGMGVGQLRSLRSLGFLANGAVWFNVIVCIVSMGAIAHYGPNIPSAQASYGTDYPYNNQPVMTANFVSSELYAKINGIFNMIFAWGGAMIFPEIMSEMRRPLDFWKGMLCAQLLILVVYLVYANVIYVYQGQYVLAQAYNGVPSYALQTVSNLLAVTSGTVAAVLYGNIGVKVVYYQVVEGIMKGPQLMSRKGGFIWFGLILVYWSLAFVIASAVPSVGSISGLIAALAILQFSYTFPYQFGAVFLIKRDAMEGEEAYVPGRELRRIDTWRDLSRWRRGFFGGKPIALGPVKVPAFLVKAFLVTLTLASYSMAGLGLYGSGTSVKEALSNGAATSFGCTAPV